MNPGPRSLDYLTVALGITSWKSVNLGQRQLPIRTSIGYHALGLHKLDRRPIEGQVVTEETLSGTKAV